VLVMLVVLFVFLVFVAVRAGESCSGADAVCLQSSGQVPRVRPFAFLWWCVFWGVGVGVGGGFGVGVAL
jgi:hypothetical protein